MSLFPSKQFRKKFSPLGVSEEHLRILDERNMYGSSCRWCRICIVRTYHFFSIISVFLPFLDINIFHFIIQSHFIWVSRTALSKLILRCLLKNTPGRPLRSNSAAQVDLGWSNPPGNSGNMRKQVSFSHSYSQHGYLRKEKLSRK